MRRQIPLCVALLTVASSAHAQVEPFRSFDRLVSSNGFGALSYDLEAARLDTFLEHSYRFAEPVSPPDARCPYGIESRDLMFDAYFGVAVDGTGSWLPDAPITAAGYRVGTNVIEVGHGVGDIEATTYSFMPSTFDAPIVIMLAKFENTGSTSHSVKPAALLNFHLGDAAGGREPSAEGEGAALSEDGRSMYEWGLGRGTFAYVPLSASATLSVAPGAYASWTESASLADIGEAQGDDLTPSVAFESVELAPGESAWAGVAAVWALDADAAPDVAALDSWLASRGPEALLADETAAWDAWHTAPPDGLSASQRALWLQSAVVLRMGQVREPGGGFGQILASLPPGLGDIHAQWNISWVRDMAYATAGLARAGHLNEARDALAFQLQAGPGTYEWAVGRPYRISLTRYFGNGAEESDCNQYGPNIEFDGFGLFLWSLGEYVRAGGDMDVVRSWWPEIRSGVADVLVSLIDDEGVIEADSSIWEVHWDGQQRHFTYTSLAAARGLCDAAMIASMIGEDADAQRYGEAGARVRDAVVTEHTAPDGVLGQSGEDVAAGVGFVDAATVEAINWGVVDPEGAVAPLTVQALLDQLTVATGKGIMRNDDGGWYDSQEWVFVDFRLIPALHALGLPGRASEVRTWLEGQALANDLQFSELHEADTGAYEGSIPMVGFGAGAYILALGADTLPAACDAFAAEPPGLSVPTIDDVAVVDPPVVMEEPNGTNPSTGTPTGTPTPEEPTSTMQPELGEDVDAPGTSAPLPTARPIDDGVPMTSNGCSISSRSGSSMLWYAALAWIVARVRSRRRRIER